MFSTPNTGKTILILLFAFTVNSGSAQVNELYYENKSVDLFFRNLYNFSFHEADSMIITLSNSNIDAATLYNINANLAWWKLLSGDAITQNIEVCKYNIDESLEVLEGNRQHDKIELSNIIYAYSLKARLENYLGHTLKSLPYFYSSLTYMDKCLKEPVKDENMYLILGLYYYFIDYIGEEYFFMNAVLFPFAEGNKELGLKYLKECALSENVVISTEANYFLLKIYSGTEKDYNKAYENAIVLTQQHPKNLVYMMEQLKLLILLNRTQEANDFQKKLISQINGSGNINPNQKKHFISQIEELKRKETFN